MKICPTAAGLSAFVVSKQLHEPDPDQIAGCPVSWAVMTSESNGSGGKAMIPGIGNEVTRAISCLSDVLRCNRACPPKPPRRSPHQHTPRPFTRSSDYKKFIYAALKPPMQA